MPTQRTICLAVLAGAFAAAALALTSSDLEKEAEKNFALKGRAAAASDYRAAAAQRVKEAQTLFPEKAPDDLSLEEMVGVGDEAEIIDGANKALDERESDARALHYLATAIDFDFGGKPLVADQWLARALSIDGISAGTREKIEKEKARIAKERDPTEHDPKPYVATPRFKRRDDIRAQIDAAGENANPNRLAGLWSQYGFTCFTCFDPDGIREARDRIAALKRKPGYYAGMWLNAIRAYDGLKVFPRPEEETASPKDLAAMGVEETYTAIAGEIDWDPEDATACIREAIESGATTIILEDKGSPWYVQTIKPKSNQRIVLKKGVKIPKFNPADYVPPAKDAKADTPAKIPVAFHLDWKGSWFSPIPTYRAIYAEDGEWKMKMFLPGTVEMGLEGKPVAYYCRSLDSKAQVTARKKGEPATVYFEVPAGDGECVVKVMSGDSVLRNPTGEKVGKTKWLDLLLCAHYFKIPRKPDKSEIWSLSYPENGSFKFFAPMNGIFAESPEALPRRRP